jgi:energy-coupling factor transporter ATP-binding protein EcfA2
MQTTDIPVTFPNDSILHGTAPVVFIGPNGSGKTRLGTTVATKSNGTRIPALRSLAFSQAIQPRAASEAIRETENRISRYRSEYYIQADEINEMLSELKAEHNDVAAKFLKDSRNDVSTIRPAPTKQETLLRIWHETFPGRQLDFSTYEPRVTSSLAGSAPEEYRANIMSDGERVAIYLIARVLRAPSGVIVVDEPEVHFHSLLARNFWNTLQAERLDCRFVFVTHDLAFALSRRGAEIGIVKNKDQVEMIDPNAGIPLDIIEEILGAASLSLVAKRIVFTEGVSGASLDLEFYGAWFQEPATTVVPVGGCRAVQEAVRVFQQKRVVSNAEPLGIIERDYFPERYLASLATTDGLFVLPVNEIESLFCVRDVAKAIAAHQGLSDSAFASIYDAFEADVRSSFSGGRLHKHLVERIKEDIDGQLDGFAIGLPVDQDAAVLRAKLISEVSIRFSGVDAGQTFDEQKQFVDNAINKGAAEFLKVLPGKDCFKILIRHLGISEDVFIDLMSAALRQPDGNEEPTFRKLKKDLVAALTPLLPPR